MAGLEPDPAPREAVMSGESRASSSVYVSCRVVSCRVASCRVVSFVSCRVVSCRSCRVVSCRVYYSLYYSLYLYLYYNLYVQYCTVLCSTVQYCTGRATNRFSELLAASRNLFSPIIFAAFFGSVFDRFFVPTCLRLASYKRSKPFKTRCRKPSLSCLYFFDRLLINFLTIFRSQKPNVLLNVYWLYDDFQRLGLFKIR